jgi:para-nitrobenzyl esterase
MQERKVDPGIGIEEPSEDCLTLNVLAPLALQEPHAVMVCFYGGAFIQGSASAALFDGTHLSDKDYKSVR